LLSGLLTAMLVPLMRSLARHAFATRNWWGVPAIVLGAGETARTLIDRLQQYPQLGFKPVACLDDDHKPLGDCARVPVAGPLSMTRPLATSLKIRHALVALPELGRDDLVCMLDQWSSVFSHVILIPNLFGSASLWVSARDVGGVLGLELRQNLLIPVNRWVKRGLDVVAALVVGVIALPVLLMISLWVKWVSRGSALYWQEREGEDGRNILVPKLRTMYPDAEKVLTRVLSQSAESRAEWICRFKLKKDPRILPGVGKFLRRTSLDELPQLWSVLIGEMSLVGPRPFPGYHLNAFGARFRALRGRAKPGLTGLWQVSDRADGDLQAQETLDTYYIRNWSLWLDLYILARTVRAVLFPRGAY
jgi:Undecaprenyl-phosphate galactose phosphotransferase WbaP